MSGATSSSSNVCWIVVEGEGWRVEGVRSCQIVTDRQVVGWRSGLRIIRVEEAAAEAQPHNVLKGQQLGIRFNGLYCALGCDTYCKGCASFQAHFDL
jgi:hypothetical protein